MNIEKLTDRVKGFLQSAQFLAQEMGHQRITAETLLKVFLDDPEGMASSLIKAAGGKLADRDAIRAGLKKADFKSLRGKFKFGTNNYPVQDFYLVKVAKRADGKYQTEIAEKVFSDYVDSHAAECPMK